MRFVIGALVINQHANSGQDALPFGPKTGVISGYVAR